MILALYGPDSYRRLKKIADIRAQYEKKHSGLTIETISLEVEDASDRALSFLSAGSLFGGSKLLILSEADEIPKELMVFLKKCAAEKERVVVLTGAAKLPKGLSFVDEKNVQEFPLLEGRALSLFIDREAKERGVALLPETKEAVALISGGESARINTEIEQLALGAVVSAGMEAPAFFPLVQTLRAGALSKRLWALSWILEREEPAAAFNVFAALVSGPLKQRMADYDILIKTGKMEYGEALLDFVLKQNP